MLSFYSELSDWLAYEIKQLDKMEWLLMLSFVSLWQKKLPINNSRVFKIQLFNVGQWQKLFLWFFPIGLGKSLIKAWKKLFLKALKDFKRSLKGFKTSESLLRVWQAM